MSAPEFVMIVEESSYGVPVAAPVSGTSRFYVPLIDGNAYSAAEDPVYQPIPYGGGWDVEADVVADHRELKGTLNTLGYPALTAFLAQLAVTRVNSGQTLPFVTTEPPYDLASVSIYHYIRTRLGVELRYRHSGMKVASFAGTCSRQDPKLKLSLELVGSKEFPNPIDASPAPDAVEFPLAVPGDYPGGCYLFSHTAGLLKYGGNALVQYDSCNFKIANKLDARWFEYHWLNTLAALGRETTVDCDLLLKSSPALRTDYLNLVISRALELTFDSGSHTFKLDFSGQNYMTKVPFDLPLGKVFMQKASFKTRWDHTAAAGAGADVIVTTT